MVPVPPRRTMPLQHCDASVSGRPDRCSLHQRSSARGILFGPGNGRLQSLSVNYPLVTTLMAAPPEADSDPAGADLRQHDSDVTGCATLRTNAKECQDSIDLAVW